MDCYSPHHVFVLFSDEGVPLGCIEVCFECYAVKYLPNKGGPKSSPDFLALAKLCFDAGLTIGEFKDFESYKTHLESQAEPNP
jgi:hypothetical protein